MSIVLQSQLTISNEKVGKLYSFEFPPSQLQLLSYVVVLALKEIPINVYLEQTNISLQSIYNSTTKKDESEFQLSFKARFKYKFYI